MATTSKTQTKKCTKCGEIKDFSEFNKKKINKLGLQYQCRECQKGNYRSKGGWFTNTYFRQKMLSKQRNYPLPNYTREELRVWCESKPIFNTLFQNWIDSGYKRLKSVSLDRIDDYLPYTFDNIRICTWKENKLHADLDSKRGINNKRSTGVSQYDKKSGVFVKSYYSQSEASRQTGISQSEISLCITGKAKSAQGYIWKMDYKNGK